MEIGICKECGGTLIYIKEFNEVICDTCEYTEEEAECPECSHSKCD